jgi:FAD-dependent oxidoreductase domain-containing protein 1
MSNSYDVIIVGGAVHGASLAYHLAADAGFGGSVVLIEKDPSFALAATALSAGSIRQQFSSPINIAISLHGIQFLRAVGERLEVDGERPDIGLSEGGYLFLATEGGAATLARNHALQTAMGADILHLDRDALATRFSYVAADDIAACAWGRSGEGWFDGYALMQALRRKARALGAETLTGDVAAITHEAGRATGVRLADGTTIAGGFVVLTAGTATPRLAASLGVALPVEARKRMVFTFSCREPLPDFPLLIDPSGAYVRPEGEIYLSGMAPPEDNDQPATDFAVDHALFEETLWPLLAARVPAFEAIKPGRAWAGHYDFNTFDQNAIVGALPGFANLMVATGFSGHGLQQAPAIGRGLAEVIVHGAYRSLDLTPLGFARIAERRPLIEENVV